MKGALSAEEYRDALRAEVEEENRNHLISYPFPLDGGEMIGNIRLPKYLTQEDADRVKAFVQTLVMESTHHA